MSLHMASRSVAPQNVPCHRGYDCEFVTPPPDAFQAKCPACLQILKEPCVISCECGQEICRECVEQIKKNNKSCPLCNLTDFTYICDYGLERYLKEQEVWCSKKKDGCDWMGKLREYEQHLNRNPSPENQLTGCQFVEVECEHVCGERFQRQFIPYHQKGLCKKRPYSCEYCREYESTFEDVTKNHHHQCNKFPVTCPNKCRETPFERQKVENHVKVECPLTEVNCPLHYAGCEVRLPRKDMPKHMRDTVTHLTLLATVTQTLLKENQELRQQLEVMQIATDVQYQELQRATEKGSKALKKEVKKLRQNIDEHKKENQELKQHIQQFEVKQSTTEANYKESKATEKEVKALKNEVRENRQNIEELRKENQKMQYEQLQSTTEDHYQATKKEVEALKKADRELRLILGRFPIDFRVNYAIKEVQHLPSFYTHSHGYCMSIRVDINGNGSGKGTHVSIFTHLMQGPYYDHLKWPFRGEITIQIVNQAGDHSHVEETIPYNDETPDIYAGRVIDKERADGWGRHQFLAHTDLEYNAAKKTQYLKDDIIIVRVIRVKITQ